MWTEGGSYNAIGRAASLTRQGFLDEVSANTSWGGYIELLASCIGLGIRAWVFTSEGHLHHVHPEGSSGFIVLRFDSGRQHWEAYEACDEAHLQQQHAALGGTQPSLIRSSFFEAMAL